MRPSAGSSPQFITVYPQPPLLPFSAHNIVTAHVKLLGHFSRNRPARKAKRPPPIDRRGLKNEHHAQGIATMFEDHLRTIPASGNSVDGVETAFATNKLQTAEMVALPQERRLPGRRWRGDALAETELYMAMTTRRATWKWKKADTQDSHLRRAVRRAGTHVQRMYNAAYTFLFKKCPGSGGRVAPPRSEGTFPAPQVVFNATGQQDRQTTSFACMGGAVTETPNLSV